jgi:hypothetical protein
LWAIRLLLLLLLSGIGLKVTLTLILEVGGVRIGRL